MIRFLYNLLFPFALLVFLPGYFVKAVRRGNVRANFGQRFALYSREMRARVASRPRTWIHAVSVGEAGIALKLARKLKQRDPAFACVLTTTTTTGFAVATREPLDWMEVMYNPLDFWPIMHRAFRMIRPVRVVMVEAEVWPNFVAFARARRIPTALVNARLSPRSERRFRKFRAFVASTFRCLDAICVVEPEDVERWRALGVPRERVHLVGSVKFDPEETAIDPTVPRQVLGRFGIDPARPILFGGSTHHGEEEILAAIYLRLRAQFPRLVLIIAPRHVERVPEILARLAAMNLEAALRSEVDRTASNEVHCLLIDTTGELKNWYAVATLVFIGKSLTARGGQNPVEAVLAGKPVLFGPHMENFAALARSLIASHAAVQVADATTLEAEIGRLLTDIGAREDLAANARAVVAQHRGATARTAAILGEIRSHHAG